MSAPKRIQLRRTKGWRKPEGAVIVDRRTQWGNPWTLADGATYNIPVDERRAWAVNRYRLETTHLGLMSDARSYHGAEMHPDDKTWADHVRRHLRGRDLACWCPLDQACHADVLLELANGGES